jgi:hypothetical protein
VLAEFTRGRDTTPLAFSEYCSCKVYVSILTDSSRCDEENLQYPDRESMVEYDRWRAEHLQMLRLKKDDEGYRNTDSEVLNATSMALSAVPKETHTYDPAASGKLCL